MRMTQKLIDLSAPLVEALGYAFEGLEYLPAQRATLRIYIGQSSGISADDCQTVSRAIGAAIEVSGLIKTAYTLEVSSPGFDRLLFTEAQFVKQLNKHVQVRLKVPREGRRQFKGVLSAVHPKAIVELTAPDGAVFTFALDEIEQARVVPQWLGSKMVRQDE